MLADILTQELPKTRFEELSELIEVNDSLDSFGHLNSSIHQVGVWRNCKLS